MLVPPKGGKTSKEELEKLARADEKMAELLKDAEIIKVIAVPDRMVNFVIK